MFMAVLIVLIVQETMNHDVNMSVLCGLIADRMCSQYSCLQQSFHSILFIYI